MEKTDFDVYKVLISQTILPQKPFDQIGFISFPFQKKNDDKMEVTFKVGDIPLDIHKNQHVVKFLGETTESTGAI